MLNKWFRKTDLGGFLIPSLERADGSGVRSYQKFATISSSKFIKAVKRVNNIKGLIWTLLFPIFVVGKRDSKVLTLSYLLMLTSSMTILSSLLWVSPTNSASSQFRICSQTTWDAFKAHVGWKVCVNQTILSLLQGLYYRVKFYLKLVGHVAH